MKEIQDENEALWYFLSVDYSLASTSNNSLSGCYVSHSGREKGLQPEPADNWIYKFK